MSKCMNIYIENLPLSITQEELKHLFMPYGTVESVFIVKDKKSGMPKGTAYVLMQSDIEAEQAISGLDGTDYYGQNLRVIQAEIADFPSGDYW